MNMEKLIEKYNELQKNREMLDNELGQLPLEYFSAFQDSKDYNLVIGSMIFKSMEEGSSPSHIAQVKGITRAEDSIYKPIEDGIGKVHVLGNNTINVPKEADAEKIIQNYFNNLGHQMEAKVFDSSIVKNAVGEGRGHPDEVIRRKALAIDELVKDFDKDYVKFVSFSDTHGIELGYASQIANMLSEHGKVAEVNTATRKAIYTPVGKTSIDMKYRW